ncbi:helix-turn-helix domain-containing protein [Hydrogenibacillus schlegelii]|uniref:helix-turn-helix domain-containing protein n=1 Tax=Hydrogenibacillus schlegelii TaxID=1484 RepID=UPI0023548D22|nr:helix-turn-helix domain-containing protein [Hydrogenibacillus schlegelii]
MERLLTPEEVAERLRVTRRSVYEWLRTGRLRGLKAGTRWRIRPEDLERFLSEEDEDEPTAEELKESYQAWLDYLAGRDPGRTLDDLRRELEAKT